MIDDDVRRLGQRNFTALLSAMTDRTQSRVAESMGVAESTVCDLKKGLERVCILIGACGLKLVSIEQRSYPPEYLRALQVLARDAIDREPPPSSFGDM